MSVQSYDEDISNNKFFVKLKNEYKILLETAAMEKWVICLPRQSSIGASDLCRTDFVLSHILAPNDELPGYHFTSLIGDNFELKSKVLIGRNNEQKRQILFEETFYTQEFYKLRIWCLSYPLINTNSQYCEFNSITTVADASNFLVLETGSTVILKILGNICAEYLRDNRSKNEHVSTDNLRNGFAKLLEKALRIIMSRKLLRDRFNSDIFKLQRLEISLALCISSHLYEFIFEAVTLINLDRNEKFNKAMQNFSDITVEDLKIPTEYIDVLSSVRKQLSMIGSIRTPVGKLEYIKKAIDKLSKDNISKPLVDDLIPILVYSIVRSGYTHWATTVVYIGEFINFFEKNFENGYESFLLTTLEAAIYFIMSENPIQHSALLDKSTVDGLNTAGNNYSTKKDFLQNLFKQIECNNEVEALKLLNVSATNEKEIFNIILDKRTLFANVSMEWCASLCHPLCDCQSCQTKVAENSPNINSYDDHGRSALHVAACKGYPRMVSILLSLGANVDAVDENRWTPLHYAACHGHQNVLLLLLHSNSNINDIAEGNISALQLAALNGHAGCVKALLYYADHMKVHHDINHSDTFGNNALHTASKWGFSEIVETLLEYGASVDMKNKLGFNPLQVAHNGKIRSLLYRSADRSVRYTVPTEKKVRKEAIFNAIKNNDIKLLYFYLYGDYEQRQSPSDALLQKSGDDVGDKSVVGSANAEDTEVLDYIDNLFDDNDLSLLQYAASLNLTEIISLLITKGVKVDRQNRFGRTALHIACQCGQAQSVATILSLTNINLVDIQDNNANTALHYAVRTANTRIVEAILQEYPDLNLRNKDGHRPIDIARKMMILNVAVLLEKSME